MEYPVGYIISSDIVLGYSMDRRDPNSISFKRYEIKFKTGYFTGWYIRGIISRDIIFVGYLIVLVVNKIIPFIIISLILQITIIITIIITIKLLYNISSTESL